MSQPSAGPARPAPPLLLTKRLNAFLHANQSPQLPTLLLTTSHGKLLAHASPHPVSLLRTYATVAASLLAIHTSSSVDLPSALPGARTPDPIASSPIADASEDGDRRRRRLRDGAYSEDSAEEDDDDEDYDDDDDTDDDDDDDDDDSLDEASSRHDVRDPVDAEGRARARRRSAAKPIKPAAITVQLSGGTVVIRRLKCDLLFVALGPAAQESHQPEQGQQPPQSQSQSQPPPPPPQQQQQQQEQEQQQVLVAQPQQPQSQSSVPATFVAQPDNSDPTGSPSETESLASAGAETTGSLESTGAASVVAMRRHTGELARWLDEKLATLRVPQEDGSMIPE